MNSTNEEMQYCFQHVKGSCLKAHLLAFFKGAMYMFIFGTILVTVCGNLIVIFSIAHFKQLHSPTNFLILSLGCADCLLGALVMPYSMVRSVETCWYFGDLFCKIHSSLDMTISVASILHLNFIAFDRYFAICAPLRYKSIITVFVVAIFIGIGWFYSLGFSFGVVFFKGNLAHLEEFKISDSCKGNCIIQFDKHLSILAPLLVFFLPAAVMISLYVKILIVASRQAKVIKEISVAVVSQNGKISKKQENRERKAAKTLGVVMGVYLLCYLPFSITTVIEPFIDFSTPVIIFDTFTWLGYFNSACNPIIYAFFYPWFQKAFQIIITGNVFHFGSSSVNLHQ